MIQRRILAVHFRKSLPSESLHELATFVLKFTPTVGIRPPDLLYLDLTSTLHLFGGEEKVVSSIQRLLLSRKISFAAALSDDVATSGVLARSMREGEIQIVPKGRNEEALALLPIDRIHFLVNPLSPPLPEEEVAAGQAISILMLLGIRTLGQFARIPSAGIGPRFGKQGVELHRRARGEGHFPFRPFEATESFIESHSFLEVVTDIEPVLFVAKGLLAKLETKLDRKLKAVTELRMVLETEDSEEIEMVIPLLRPLKREKSLLPLIREKLSNVALISPLHSFSIELSLPVQSTGSQFHLFDSREENSEQLDELLGRLVAGLGPSFISAAALRERYRPERSWEKVTFEPFQRNSKSVPAPVVLFKRPSVIVNPQPLQAERRGDVLCLRSPSEKFEVTRLVGPERLAGEWWDEASHERDYFRAETKTGQHLWIFKPLREAATSFFLHGYFD